MFVDWERERERVIEEMRERERGSKEEVEEDQGKYVCQSFIKKEMCKISNICSHPRHGYDFRFHFFHTHTHMSQPTEKYTSIRIHLPLCLWLVWAKIGILDKRERRKKTFTRKIYYKNARTW